MKVFKVKLETEMHIASPDADEAAMMCLHTLGVNPDVLKYTDGSVFIEEVDIDSAEANAIHVDQEGNVHEINKH